MSQPFTARPTTSLIISHAKKCPSAILGKMALFGMCKARMGNRKSPSV